MPALLRRIARYLTNAMLVLLALSVLGCFLPRLPVLGEIGPLLISAFGPWLAILSLVGAALLWMRWRGNQNRRTLILAGLAAFAGLGAVAVQTRQIVVARHHGVQIDLVAALMANSQAEAGPPPVTVAYSRYDGKDLPLDIYRPAAQPGARPAPVFVYIHGGGWGAETLKQRVADYRWFARRGYLVISLEYPLSSETRHTWNIAQPQLGCALAWINANAARYGGDASRLALWGESAGGNLVLTLSYMANAGTLAPSCKGTVPHISATMALYPVIDPARMYRNSDPLVGVFGRMMTVNYTGGTPDQFPDRYAAIAPATYLSGKAPPTLLIIPEADHLVSPAAAYSFADQARAGGIDTRLIRMPYAEHSFDLRSGSIGNQLVRQTMLRFLEEHGLKS